MAGMVKCIIVCFLFILPYFIFYFNLSHRLWIGIKKLLVLIEMARQVIACIHFVFKNVWKLDFIHNLTDLFEVWQSSFCEHLQKLEPLGISFSFSLIQFTEHHHHNLKKYILYIWNTLLKCYQLWAWTNIKLLDNCTHTIVCFKWLK